MTTFSPSPLESSEEQYGRSDGYLDQTGHASGSDRSASVSFELWTHLSPQSAQSVSMEFNLSDGTSSDHSFPFNPADLDIAAQMSNDFVSPDVFQQQSDYLLMAQASQSFQGSNGSFEQSLNTSALPFGSLAQSGFSHGVRHNAENVPSVERFHSQQWVNGPSIKFESNAEDDTISPSTLPTHQTQGPWSSQGPGRYAGHAMPHPVPWGLNPNSNALNSVAASYAPSDFSHGSSPHIPGMTTPDSARSPRFSTAIPNSSSGSSIGGDSVQRTYHHSIDQIPRPLQTAFQQSNFMNQQHDISPHSVLIDPSALQQLHRDPSHSPMSDFVVVDRADAVSATYSDDYCHTHAKERKVSQKSARKSVSNRPRQQADNFVSEYPPATGAIRRQSNEATKKARDGKRVGGRSVGMHLKTDVAARAKQLRDEGSCWICCFQRDSCSPGIVCDRCQKRHQRSQMEHGLQCDRTKLNDLRPYFIPDFLARSGDRKVLNEFMDNHIHRWGRKPLKLRINIIWGQTPMELELYEFEPKTAELVRHLQSVLDEKTGKRNWVNKGSPPLAMVSIEPEDRHCYERYIDNIVDHPANLEKFVDRCYKYEKDDFQARLFRLMYEYQPTAKDEKSLRRDIMRLQIITYIYSRASTIVNGDLHLLSTLHYTAANRVAYGKATTARLANRQLKYLYTSLWIQIMENVLKKLQQVLRSSRGGAKWSSAFVAVLGLGMAFETIQMTSHTHQEADEIMGNTTSWDARERAERACRVIDEKFFFLATLFRWKYHRGFNPFRNIHDRGVHQDLGPNALQLVQGVHGLVQEKSEYLAFREQVAILQENKEKYTSRLVAKFLLAFWKPVA